MAPARLLRGCALLLAAAAAQAGAELATAAAGRGTLPQILHEDDSCPAGSAACALNALQYTGSENGARRIAGSGTLVANDTSRAKLLQLATGIAAAAIQGLEKAREGSGGCIAGGFLQKFASSVFSCSTIKRLSATSQQLPAFLGCHTQGIAVDEASKSVVITCEDMTLLSAKGRIGLWPTFASAAKALTVKGDTGNLFTQFHPSATQMLNGVVPIFFANPLDAGPSTLRFYALKKGRLSGPVGQTVVHPESHMGAVGFASIAGKYVIVGCGWDCKQFGVWVSSTGPVSGYSRTFYTADSSSMVDGGSGNAAVSAYNSLYLTVDCTTSQPYLFASLDDRLEIWKINGLLTNNPRMTKLTERSFAPSGIFSEGFTMLPAENGNDATVYAISSDFHSCRAGECAENAYLCSFE